MEHNSLLQPEPRIQLQCLPGEILQINQLELHNKSPISITLSVNSPNLTLYKIHILFAQKNLPQNKLFFKTLTNITLKSIKSKSQPIFYSEPQKSLLIHTLHIHLAKPAHTIVNCSDSAVPCKLYIFFKCTIFSLKIIPLCIIFIKRNSKLQNFTCKLNRLITTYKFTNIQIMFN